MFKKISAIIISAAVVLSGAVFATAESYIKGDVNSDGMLSVSDVVTLRAIIIAGKEFTADELNKLDVDSDGKVTVSDVVALRNVIMGGGADVDPNPEPDDGWKTVDGNRYYYKNGTALTGRQTINGLRYDFNSEGVCLTTAGVDVSYFNTITDWDAVKEQGVEFAIARIGYRGYGAKGIMQKDSKYESNMSGAIAAGLDVGVYFFSQAVNADEGKEEADFVLANLGKYSISYPIVLDVEYYRLTNGDIARADNISKADRTAAVKAFCKRVLEKGYYPVIYANPDMCNTGLNMSELGEYDLWLAHYTTNTSFALPFTIWQYSSDGIVNGISGRTDINMCYKNYPDWLKQNGYNKLVIA